ncbi:MAG: hypothetical protein ACQERD_06905 [Campylobacterota bacterium]
MSEIKNRLKELVQTAMIPEVQSYIHDLSTDIAKNKNPQDNMEALKEMESFLEELKSILAIIDDDAIPNDEYERIYNKIMENMKKHQ